MEELKIKAHTKAEDFKRALLDHNKIKFIGLTIVTIAFFLFIIIGVFFFLSSNSNISLVIFLPILFPALLFAFVLFSTYRATTQQSLQLAENSKEILYIFEENGFWVNSDSGSVKTLWSELYKITERKNDFLIFPQNNIFFPIPNRFFENDSQIKAFRKLTQENLGVNAKLVK